VPVLGTIVVDEGAPREEGRGQHSIRPVSLPETYGAEVDSLPFGVEGKVYLPDEVVHRKPVRYSVSAKHRSVQGNSSGDIYSEIFGPTRMAWEADPEVGLNAIEAPDRMVQFGARLRLLIERVRQISPPVRSFQIDFSPFPVVFRGEEGIKGVSFSRVLAARESWLKGF
jgi:hypothetical protein